MLVVAAIGVVLPLLPTTPFALLSVYFFSKSSPKFYSKVLHLPIIGAAVINWRKNKSIPIKAKISATILLLITITLIILRDDLTLYLKIPLPIFLVSLIAWIILRPSGEEIQCKKISDEK